MSAKLLIADDEEIIRRGVRKYIQLHTDCFERIYEAENGQETIDILLKHQPEIVLLDVQMPIKNGIEVMKEAHRAGVHPIIIILSGYDDFKYAQQAMKYGAREYLLKPVRAADILECVSRLAGELLQEEKSQPADTGAEPGNHFVREAQEYIREHYNEELSLNEVAEATGISRGYLSTMFTQNLGMGFVDFLNQVRIERACCYLEQNSLKNYEIAYKVGYRDEKYFSRVFKKLKGISPKEYRSLHKQV